MAIPFRTENNVLVPKFMDVYKHSRGFGFQAVLKKKKVLGRYVTVTLFNHESTKAVVELHTDHPNESGILSVENHIKFLDLPPLVQATLLSYHVSLWEGASKVDLPKMIPYTRFLSVPSGSLVENITEKVRKDETLEDVEVNDGFHFKVRGFRYETYEELFERIVSPT